MDSPWPKLAIGTVIFWLRPLRGPGYLSKHQKQRAGELCGKTVAILHPGGVTSCAIAHFTQRALLYNISEIHFRRSITVRATVRQSRPKVHIFKSGKKSQIIFPLLFNDRIVCFQQFKSCLMFSLSRTLLICPIRHRLVLKYLLLR